MKHHHKMHHRRMHHHRKMLMLSLLTIPLQSTVAFAEPLSEQDCFTPSCEHQLYTQRRGSGDRGDHRKAEKLMEQLNLSEQQVEQLNAIREKYRPEMEQLRQKMQTTRRELRQMMQGNASIGDIRVKHQEVVNIDQQWSNLRFESMLEMRETLTPEQRNQFAQLMEQRRAGRGNRRQGQPNP